MAESKYITAPIPSTKMPRSVPYILVNETAERFSFYGMTSILVVFTTHYLMGPGGVRAVMSEDQSKEYFHLFNFAVYFMPLIGALISDIWLGKFRTIIFFSLVYCLGFVTLVLDLTRFGLALGLVLIAVGSGIIKPCVSANVGDQFGKSNKHLLSKVYSWFYFAINLGACFSMLLCPWLLDTRGPRVGFGVPAIFMFVATAAYWLGRRKFVHIPVAGIESVKNTLRGEPIRALGRLCILYLFIAMFWSLFYQSQSAWVLQAENMNLRWLWITWLPAQVQFVNSLLIMILIPLFAYVIYPAINKLFPLTPLRKISIGLFVTALSFVVPAMVEAQITAGGKPSIGWQFFAYVILTAAEVMVSITCLEFSYTQAPKSTKSFVQALFLLSISLGNAFAAIVNAFIQNEDGTSKTAVAFIPVAARYREKSYIQDESSQDKRD
jgi:POT family proton-dependent oligopeptide transporter